MKGPYKGKFRVSQKFKGQAHDGLDLVGVDSKNIYSTVNGVVEYSGWENPKNHLQGFGMYVRIRKENSIDKYYYGHLSKLNVKAGQTVKIGDLLGVEGSTGRSTGSHCHYCIRGNGSPALIRDLPAVSGIPNQIGTYTSTLFEEETNEEPQKQTITEIAKEVINGKWGNGNDRKERLKTAGFDYSTVQKEVNRLLNTPQKSNEEIAREVIKGLWGNGNERKVKLKKAGYDYNAIQKLVNQLI